MPPSKFSQLDLTETKYIAQLTTNAKYIIKIFFADLSEENVKKPGRFQASSKVADTDYFPLKHLRW